MMEKELEELKEALIDGRCGVGRLHAAINELERHRPLTLNEIVLRRKCARFEEAASDLVNEEHRCDVDDDGNETESE